LTFTFIIAYFNKIYRKKKEAKNKNRRAKKEEKEETKAKAKYKQLLNVRRLSLYYPVIGESLDIVSLSFT
tara:strand:- start:23 stop:232 length:210 start_codon:yes stop_codon:yes gene_type:complete